MRKQRVGRVIQVALAGGAVIALLAGGSALLRGSGRAEVPAAGELLPDGPPGVRIVEADGGRELVVVYGPIELPANASHHDVVQDRKSVV